ncbi:MAG: N-terminal phage integrase SAM-like domain-containing protein [Defluviitaleaceae bacterium]|nr:N-terminal phage integrase SAM-like domain-containing protein [Defluviitaleaceae bacterium]
MTTKTKNGLPSGVSVMPNREGLYRLRVQVRGKSHVDYCRPAETGKKRLQSELQKAIDAFRERVELGTLKSGDINDKSTFSEAVAWFMEIRKLDTRESTQMSDKFNFEHYLIPRIGNYKLREITSPMITKLLAELREKGGGGGRATYAAKPEFVKLVYEQKPARTAGGFNLVARELGIGVDNTFVRIRQGRNCEKHIAEKVAKHYGLTLSAAFDKKIDVKPLAASFVSKITYTMSALFTACVKMGYWHKTLLRMPQSHGLAKKIHRHILTIHRYQYFLMRLQSLM